MNKHPSEAADVTEGVSDKAVKGVKAVGKVFQKYPYKTIGIALGIGAIIGLFIYCQSSKKSE
jgi:ElaB/YqjD/DUF883 family membrane-anchored ribosome-binding protein